MDSVYLQYIPEAVAEQGGREVQVLRTETAQIRRLEEDGKQCLRLGEHGFPVSREAFSLAHAPFPRKPKGN